MAADNLLWVLMLALVGSHVALADKSILAAWGAPPLPSDFTGTNFGNGAQPYPNGWTANLGSNLAGATVTGQHTRTGTDWRFATAATFPSVTPLTGAEATLVVRSNTWATGNNVNTWNNNYVQFQFSAADYTTIRFHTRMGRADGAPPTFRLAYSTDGTTFTNVDTFDVPASGTTNNDLDYGLSNADGSPTVYVRIIQAAAASGTGQARIFRTYVTGDPVCSTPGLCADPHLQGFNGQSYAFCEENDGAHCKGLTFNMLTSQSYLLNAQLNRHAGPNAWPHAGTWMTGFGFRYADVLSFEVGLNTNVDWDVVPDEARGGTSTRAAAVEGGFKKVLSFLRINGKDAMPQVEGDQTFQLASDTVVFLPAAKHAHDPISGPIAIIRTPDFQIGVSLEAGDIWHLDMQIKIVSPIKTMHGLIGQSINWAPGTPAIVEGGEMAYVIKEGGLLGHGFDYNLFINGKQAHSTLATRSRRALLALDLSMVGKTAGAHVGTSMQFF